MAKILIIGAKGNLGQQLAKAFEEGNVVVAWDRHDADVTKKGALIKKIEGVMPDIIINTTAYNAMDKCEEDEKEFELAKKINGKAVGYLAEAALKTEAVLVHFSSDYVFDGENRRGYDEASEPKPISRYGETKLMGEKAILASQKKGLKYYLIRSSKLFGPKGESANSKESFFDLILRLSKERDSFNMVDGEEISCFTYTKDLALAVRALVESGKEYGVYHIVNSGSSSWYEAAKFLFELKNVMGVKLNPSNSLQYPRPAKRPKFSILLNTKLDLLRDWQEALREYLK